MIVLVLAIQLSSCQNQSSGTSLKDPSGNTNPINTSLSEDDFEKKLSDLENPQLLDVRTPEEFKEGRLKGALNYNVNSGDFENQIADLDKKRPVLVYCLSGGRSSYAANVMAGQGFLEVYNLAGGIMKWNAKNKPIENGEMTIKTIGLSKSDFNELITSEKLVLVDYNAKWCKPCQKMAPMLEALAESKKDILTLVKIDADENKALLKENGIEAIPVLELYKNGKRVWIHEGEISESKLKEQTAL
jgi:thioredoxin